MFNETQRRGGRDSGSALPAPRALALATAVFAAGLGVHNADHVRRGVDATTPEVFWAGMVVFVASLTTIMLVVIGHRLAPVFAVAVGFATAAGVTASHLLPRWSALSDSLPDGHLGAVTWVAVFAEIIGALVLAVAGLAALRHEREALALRIRAAHR
jgi:hypothetical protein